MRQRRTRLLALALTSLILACAPVASARLTAWQLIDQAESFTTPTGAVVGSHGEIWLSGGALNTTRGLTYAIARADLGGHFKLFRAPAPSSSIAALPDGTVYATESVAGGRPNRLLRIRAPSPVGEVRLPDAAANAADVIAGPDGNAWFVENSEDATINAVGRVTPAGQLSEFPLPPVSVAGLPAPASPTAIAAGGGNTLWVAVQGGIDQLSSAGAVLQTIALGTSEGDEQLAVAGDGSVWVSGNGTLTHVSAGGAISPIGLPQQTEPGAIATGPDGQVYFMAGLYSGVWRASGPGAPLATQLFVDIPRSLSFQRYKLFPQPGHSLAAGPDGTLIVMAELEALGGGTIESAAVVQLGTSCVVPQLSLLGVSQARHELAAHQCALGKVRQLKEPGSDVVCVHPKPGSVLAVGARVAVTLGAFLVHHRC